jgi:hypothetical protein
MNILHEGATHELGAIISDDQGRDSEAAHQSFQELDSSTSGHFVNLSLVTNKNSKPPVAGGKGPKILSPQTMKGHDKGIV